MGQRHLGMFSEKVIYKISSLLIDDADKQYDQYSASENESDESATFPIQDICEDDGEEEDFEEEDEGNPAMVSFKFVCPIRSSLFEGGPQTIRFLKENEIGRFLNS